MKNSYSRREIQGWGSVKQPLVSTSMNIINVEVDPKVLEAYSAEVEELVGVVMSGLGYPRKQQLDSSDPDQLQILDIYDDIENSAYSCITSIWQNQQIKGAQ